MVGVAGRRPIQDLEVLLRCRSFQGERLALITAYHWTLAWKGLGDAQVRFHNLPVQSAIVYQNTSCTINLVRSLTLRPKP